MAVTFGTKYPRMKIKSSGAVQNSSSHCVGYETLNANTGQAQWRAIVFDFTVGAVCTGITINIKMVQYEKNNSGAYNIYGKIYPSSTAVNTIVNETVGTTSGTLLRTVPAGAAANSDQTLTGTIEANGFILQPSTTYRLVIFSSLSTGYAVLYYATSYSTTATEYQGGLVKINVDNTSSGWKRAIPYVNIDGTSTGWRRAIPFINVNGTSTGWKRGIG